MVLDFIKANSTAKILSNPQLTVVDGQQASITVGDQIPYRTTVIQNGTAVGQVNFANAGVELSVTPVIFKDDFVNLIIQPSITSRTGDFDGIPIISTKVTNITLNIRNNHTVIMGGLISHSDSIEQNQNSNCGPDTEVSVICLETILGLIEQMNLYFSSRLRFTQNLRPIRMTP